MLQDGSAAKGHARETIHGKAALCDLMKPVRHAPRFGVGDLDMLQLPWPQDLLVAIGHFYVVTARANPLVPRYESGRATSQPASGQLGVLKLTCTLCLDNSEFSQPRPRVLFFEPKFQIERSARYRCICAFKFRRPTGEICEDNTAYFCSCGYLTGSTVCGAPPMAGTKLKASPQCAVHFRDHV